MDPAPWNLLHDGVVIAIDRHGATVRVQVDAGYLRAEPFVLRLEGVESLVYLPYEGHDDVTELSAITCAEPDIVEAALETDGTLAVWGSRGSLRLRYAALAIEGLALDQLRSQVRAYWDGWRQRWAQDAHPLVTACVGGGAWQRDQLPSLIEAWRGERTSDLADTIEILDELTRGPAPLALVVDGVLVDPTTIEAWATSWRHEPGAALAELERAATATFDLGHEALGRYWEAITRATSALADAAPDPRIGRAMIGMLRSPSDHWFRSDQVAHVAGPFPASSGDPSFADLALSLIELHADAGIARQLEDRARLTAIECDCNGAEMVERLQALAATVRERYPADRELAAAAATALRNRALTR